MKPSSVYLALFLSLLCTAAAQTLVPLTQPGELAAAFMAETGNVVSSNDFGAWGMLGDGDHAYLVMGSGQPSGGANKALFSRIADTGLEHLGLLDEQGGKTIVRLGERIWVAGEDPSGAGNGWDSGNLYHFTETNGLTKLRYKGDGTPALLKTTTTDAQGRFAFTELPTEYLYVKVVPPSGFSIPAPDTSTRVIRKPAVNTSLGWVAGNDETGFRLCEYHASAYDLGLRSNANAVVINPTAGPPITYTNGPSSISGTIWDDVNGDGMQDAGEPLLSGVRVELLTRQPYFSSMLHGNKLMPLKDGKTMYFFGSGYGSDNEAAIYKTTDGGDHWEAFACEGWIYGRKPIRDGFFSTRWVLDGNTNWYKAVTWDSPTGQVEVATGMGVDFWQNPMRFRNKVVYAEDSTISNRVVSGHFIAIDDRDFSVTHTPYPAPASRYWPGVFSGGWEYETPVANALAVVDGFFYFAAENGEVYRTQDLSTWELVAMVPGEIVSISAWEDRHGLLVCTRGDNAAVYLYTPQPTGTSRKVLILAGQSNAVGRGGIAGDLPPALQAPDPRIQLWYDNDWHYPNSYSSNQRFVPLQAVPGNFDGQLHFGAELMLGKTVADKIGATTNDPLYVIKLAAGGTSLGGDWAPGSALRDHYTCALRIALEEVEQRSENGNVDLLGFFWMQGENDAVNTNYANAYEANLTQWIADVRALTEDPILPFFVTKTYVPTNVRPAQVVVEAAQIAVACNESNTWLIETIDLPHAADQVHVNHDGLLQLGVRMADTLFAVEHQEALAITINGLSISTVPPYAYELWHSPDLNTWSSLTNLPAASTPQLDLSLPLGPGQRGYYEWRALKP